MRIPATKIMAGTLIAGAALMLAACHHESNSSTADTNMTDLNTMDSSAGMTNDMSATDAMGNEAGAATGNGAATNP